MRKTVILACVLWLAAVAVPILLWGSPTDGAERNTAAPEERTETAENGKTEDSRAENSQDAVVTVHVMMAGREVSYPLDAYLAGVLAAEMPASFPEEALKAQAVAARSFILYRMQHPPADGVHDGVPLCDNPAHCKAYRDITTSETAAALFGSNSESDRNKIRAAVRETDGVVLTYDGDPAMAAFHAIAGGRTESAEDVWGTSVPYLVEVDSPGEENAVKFTETVEFQPDALRETLLGAYPDAKLGEDPAEWLTEMQRSPAGMIKSAVLGGMKVSGMELRQLLGLNSADFVLEVRDGTVFITTTGYGHGVGMSQYGARAMALAGADYTEILLHYYTGCALDSLEILEILAEN